MGQRIAEQIPIEEYSSHNAESYRVPELEGNELSGVVFNLPNTPSISNSRPVLCVYSGEDLTGYFFTGESFHQEALSGIEGPGESEVLESGNYPSSEISPFLGRNDSVGEGFRGYKMPVDDSYGLEIVAEIRPDKRSEEKLCLNESREGTITSQLLIGRTEDGWDFLSGKPQQFSEKVI